MSGPVIEAQYENVLVDALLSTNPETEPIYVGGFRTANVAIVLVHDAATKVDMECLVAFPSDDSKWFVLQEVDFSAPPIYTSSDAVWSKNVIGNANWIWRIPTDCTRMKFVFSALAPGTDAISVTVRVDAG